MWSMEYVRVRMYGGREGERVRHVIVASRPALSLLLDCCWSLVLLLSSWDCSQQMSCLQFPHITLPLFASSQLQFLTFQRKTEKPCHAVVWCFRNYIYYLYNSCFYRDTQFMSRSSQNKMYRWLRITSNLYLSTQVAHGDTRGTGQGWRTPGSGCSWN